MWLLSLESMIGEFSQLHVLLSVVQLQPSPNCSIVTWELKVESVVKREWRGEGFSNFGP